MKYGLQMYSVRDTAQNDLLGALEQVSKLGYHYAEFAGFFNDKIGLVFFDRSEQKPQIRRQIKFAQFFDAFQNQAFFAVFAHPERIFAVDSVKSGKDGSVFKTQDVVKIVNLRLSRNNLRRAA